MVLIRPQTWRDGYFQPNDPPRSLNPPPREAQVRQSASRIYDKIRFIGNKRRGFRKRAESTDRGTLVPYVERGPVTRRGIELAPPCASSFPERFLAESMQFGLKWAPEIAVRG